MRFFFSLLEKLRQRCFAFLDRTFRRWTTPPKSSVLRGTLRDVPRSKVELLAENALSREQLAILQRQVNHPPLTRRDRFWLLALASRVTHWTQALVIIQPDTLLRWHRAGLRLFWKHKSKPKPPQPKIPAETIALIQRMERENRLWGAERIQGELLKLEIHVAKSTIQRYLLGVRPPREPSPNWSTFLKNHSTDVWACDFLPMMDLWFRTVFVFFIIELGSRRLVHFGITRHPTEVWVAQQLREATPNGVAPKYLIRDNDRKFGTQFDRVAKGTGMEVLKIPYRAPRANALCERFLGSVRRECLDRLLIFSDGQLYRVIREYVGYFNCARPHQGIGQKIPAAETVQGEISAQGNVIRFPGLRGGAAGERNTAREEVAPAGPAVKGKIIAFPVLNGFHHDYRRAA